MGAEGCTVHDEALSQRAVGGQWAVYDVPLEMEASHRRPAAGVDRCHLPGHIAAQVRYHSETSF